MATNLDTIYVDLTPSTETEHLQTPLLTTEEELTIHGFVDFKHHPAVRSRHGGWRSSTFIIGVEVAERMCYCGLSSNLINFLTGKLGESTAMAAANVNAWTGVATLLTILGGFVADSLLGKFHTILVSSLIYILGLGLLTVSAMLPSPSFLNDIESFETAHGCSRNLQIITFFVALYLVAVGQGGYRPSVESFGADQFDGEDPRESEAKSSFFNWWYFGVCVGYVLGVLVLSYVQDNLSWALGFGIPCITMVVAFVIFLLGTMTYRYVMKGEGRVAFKRIGKVFVAAARNWHAANSKVDGMEDPVGTQPYHGSQQFRFLDKALHATHKEDGKACSIAEVEEAKGVLRLFPIWASSFAFGIIFSQTNTFFTKQGVTLDRSIGSSFVIPAAALQSLIGICVVIILPIYDRVFVPVARVLTGKPSGITMLQRIGIGLLISIITMMVAAVIEKKRLMIALEHELIELPEVILPMSICWLLPQYVLFGIAEAFTMVGLQEFFYDQMPNELRSVGLSLYLSVFGMGSLLSSLLVSIIDKATSGQGRESWFSNNLNRAHLDYFYWVLAGLGAIGFAFLSCFAKSYIYIKKSNHM